MHRWVFLPPRKNPVDETFKCRLLGLAIISPPIIETQVVGGIRSNGSEKIFESLFFQRVPFHVEADIQGRGRRQECEATTRIILSGTQDHVYRRNCLVVDDPRDTPELARTLAWALDHPEEVRALAARGRALMQSLRAALPSRDEHADAIEAGWD